METLVLDFIPSLDGQTTLILIVSCVFTLWFGGLFFQFFTSLLKGFTDKW